MIKLALLVVAWCVTKSIAKDTVAAAASALRLAITFVVVAQPRVAVNIAAAVTNVRCHTSGRTFCTIPAVVLVLRHIALAVAESVSNTVRRTGLFPRRTSNADKTDFDAFPQGETTRILTRFL
jgi:hypothetical protein